MPNLFFYVGAVFLRENGQAPIDVRREAQFAMQNLLPRDMSWERVSNVDAGTAGRPDQAGTRTFRHSKDASSGSYAEQILGSLRKSALDKVRGAERDVHQDIESTSILAKPTGPKVTISNQQLSNSSGRIQKTELDTLIAGMINNLDSGKLFAVGDCNSFHNVAYIFGNVALHRKAAPILVLNIDQHKDIGNTSNGFVASDTWGTSMLLNVPVGAYLVAGSGGKSGGSQLVGQYKARGGNVTTFKPTQSVTTQNATSGTGLGGALNAALTELQVGGCMNELVQSVYITVDRDCMVDNWTQWADIAAIFTNCKKVIAFLDEFMTQVIAVSPTAQLVGMDITGLPECGFGPVVIDEEAGTMAPDTNRYRYAQIRAEISAYHDFFSKWANRNVQGSQGYIKSASTGLRCCSCGTEHGYFRSSYFGRWHRCDTCHRVYCSKCGGKLERANALPSLLLIDTTRERSCEGVNFNGQVCPGVTELID